MLKVFCIHYNDFCVFTTSVSKIAYTVLDTSMAVYMYCVCVCANPTKFLWYFRAVTNEATKRLDDVSSAKMDEDCNVGYCDAIDKICCDVMIVVCFPMRILWCAVSLGLTRLSAWRLGSLENNWPRYVCVACVYRCVYLINAFPANDWSSHSSELILIGFNKIVHVPVKLAYFTFSNPNF